MRIAYLSLHWPRPATSGVGKKMLQQMRVWREQGHEVCFFSHRHAYPNPSELIPGVQTEYCQVPGKVGLLRTEWSRMGAMRQMLAKIKDYRPDLIYLRSAIYVYPLHRLFALAPVVIEINTNEDSQHRLLGSFYHTYFQLTNDILLKRASGVICISREIAQSIGQAYPGKPVCAILNGFDFSSVEPLLAPANPVPHLVFIGSPGNPWHAVEKLVTLARGCPDIMIDVVGYDRLDVDGPLPENLHLHGYLRGEDYTRVLSQADASIGSLGLHRINMQEGSPLKTSECLAYGLPLILPYKETDLEDLQADWLLEIPNCEDNVATSTREIHDFLYRVRGVRTDRAVLVPRLDARVKEMERLKFFRDVQERAA